LEPLGDAMIHGKSVDITADDMPIHGKMKKLQLVNPMDGRFRGEVMHDMSLLHLCTR
jgi:hypothetical protein